MLTERIVPCFSVTLVPNRVREATAGHKWELSRLFCVQCAEEGLAMYTGIVQAMCPLTFVERAPNLMRFGITLPLAIAEEVTLGARIAINGCCFTVTRRDA